MLSDPSYRLVFDATQKYGDRTVFAIGFALAVLAACLVGGMLVVHAVRRGHHRRLLSALGVASILLVLLASVGASLVIVWTVASTAVSADEARRAIDASPVVEGIVENFHPMPSGGHDTERFDVAGVHFEYSHWMTTQGFSQDITVGGPMRSGLHVRIHYVRFGTPPYENVIVRIELRE
jgi:hypothetical protein